MYANNPWEFVLNDLLLLWSFPRPINLQEVWIRRNLKLSYVKPGAWIGWIRSWRIVLTLMLTMNRKISHARDSDGKAASYQDSTNTFSWWVHHFSELIRMKTNYCNYFFLKVRLNSEKCLRAFGKLSQWFSACLIFHIFQLILPVGVLHIVHRNLFFDCDPFCSFILIEKLCGYFFPADA